MVKGKLGSRLDFHDWEQALQQSCVPCHRKESWAITIRWYLSWAKRARVPVDFDSARDFMAQVEMEKHPTPHRLEQWKEALRRFFRQASAPMVLMPVVRMNHGPDGLWHEPQFLNGCDRQLEPALTL